MSPSRRVSCVAASLPTPTTSDLPSRVRSAARSAMSSRSRSVAGIIVRCIAHATSARGGGRPVSTRSRLPAGFGKRHTKWDSGGPNERHYLDRMALPRPLTQCQRTRTSALLQRRKKKPAYRTFQASRARAAGCSRTVTMWRPTERRRSCRRGWRDGLADQTVVQNLEHLRCYRAFERSLIGSVDPRSMLELALVHRLASLLWRLRRASAIETALFEIQGELLLARRQDPSRSPSQAGTFATPTQTNGHSKGPGSNGRDHPPASDQEPPSTTSVRPPLGPWSKSFLALQARPRMT